MSRTTAPPTPEINEHRFNIACRIVEQARDGFISAMLTGQGEPTLYPKQITRYLELMNFRFPLVDLQTNGVRIESLMPDTVRRWRNLGLTGVCLSIMHHVAAISNEIMDIRDDYNFWRTVDLLHGMGLAVRLNCTLIKCGVGNVTEVLRLIGKAHDHGVEQLTLREVVKPDEIQCTDAAEAARCYVEANKPVGLTQLLAHNFHLQGATKLLELPHGAVVYDYNGQNVCLSTCLTDTADPNDIRQIIFFPDGKIGFDWKYEGARIL
jgi:molybdenum cofactor biosynthesis enzyme MoaA